MCHIHNMRTFFGMAVLFLAPPPHHRFQALGNAKGGVVSVSCSRSDQLSPHLLSSILMSPLAWASILFDAIMCCFAADIVKMIESQPELESQLRRVRGGYLKIQGTWMPYEVRSAPAHMRYPPFPAAMAD